jgi:hypothetical protein
LPGRRLRSILEPVLYIGIATLLHSALFLIPGMAPAKKEAVTTQRGVRVRAFVERPVPQAKAEPSASRSIPKPVTGLTKPVPEPQLVTTEKNYSVLGSRNGNGESMVASTQASGAKGTGGSSNTEAGGGGSPSQSSSAKEAPVPQSAFGKYLASIRSKNVQGWAKESALKSRQGWKGTGAGEGNGAGWGNGTGSGSGGGRSGSGSGAGGSGSGKSGSGSGGNGAFYMDPRVKLVVTSYPSTGIERKFTPIPYPNLKFKQSKFTSGWWNVYIKVRTDSAGTPVGMEVLRPETDGVLERQFVDQVKREVSKWDFDPKEAEIHVDVRFYVE